jgi:glycerate kinase
MRILLACDKFKGSLSAMEACEALRDGLRAGGCDAEFVLAPIADGGEGFAGAMVAAMGGRWTDCASCDALGRPIRARYGLCPKGDQLVAVMEMAEAAGMWRFGEAERDVMRASTAGVGRMIRHAAKRSKADVVLLGIGGSATNDGGAGLAAALGVAFRDARGWELEPVPEGLEELAEICMGGRILLPHIEVACDVENPLLGPGGATAVYGPQKGAGPDEQARLEAFLEKLVKVAGAEEAAATPGAGAAGGLGFGMLQFADAVLRPGFEMVADALGLEQQVRRADVVITGEGSLDGQTLSGKGPAGVARMAREAGVRIVGVGGRVAPEVRESGVFDHLGSLEVFGLPVKESMTRGGELLQLTGGKLADLLRSVAAS